MELKLPHSLLTQFLKTQASPATIARNLSLCGPTVDFLNQTPTDFVYHLEIITNRIDTVSALGIAREASAILNTQKIPASLINDPYTNSYSSPNLNLPLPITLNLPQPKLTPRFTCIALKNIQIKPSPKTTVSWLELAGQRSLNNVVDITNELTLKYGQPVHVFDLDKISNRTLTVRTSRPGEKITTLDNRTHQLKGDDIVIEDGANRLIDLCGIMGGSLAEVDQKTKNILLFVQTYEPKRIRKTSLDNQARTLAAQIFEKQPDPELVLPVLYEGIQLLGSRAAAEASSRVLDLYPAPSQPRTILLDINWLTQFVGINLTKNDIIKILNYLGFICQKSHSTTLTFKVPSWRQYDVKIKEDLAEEITRVYGYYRLPSRLPSSHLNLIPINTPLKLETNTRQFLAHIGFTEIYNSSLISSDFLKNSGYNPKSVFSLANPLSSDYQFMRPTLLPSLLNNLQNNQNFTENPIMLFELANTYHPGSDKKLADEKSTLCFVINQQDFFTVKGIITNLSQFWHVPLRFDTPNLTLLPKLYDPNQSLALFIHDHYLGHLGILINQAVTACELNFDLISQHPQYIHHFLPLSPYNPVIEDLTFTFPLKTAVGPVIDFIKSLSPLIQSVQIKSTYAQNITFTLKYQSHDQQLSNPDLVPLRLKVVNQINQKFHGQLVGKLN